MSRGGLSSVLIDLQSSILFTMLSVSKVGRRTTTGKEKARIPNRSK
jgi:hypothetical protein